MLKYEDLNLIDYFINNNYNDEAVLYIQDLLLDIPLKCFDFNKNLRQIILEYKLQQNVKKYSGLLYDRIAINEIINKFLDIPIELILFSELFGLYNKLYIMKCNIIVDNFLKNNLKNQKK